MNTVNKKAELLDGIKKGIPIGLGYLAVSFTFGIWAVEGGMPIWMVIFISLSNLTSAGQFAGTGLILGGAAFFEIGLSVLIINLRYSLMSLSLTQKLSKTVKPFEKWIFGFGVTDEVFAVAATEKKPLTSIYMYGLISMPIVGWTLGTALGAIVGSILPPRLSDAMGIGLYAMFIAIIVPPSKKSWAILGAVLISIVITCIIKYIPAFSFISAGFTMIIATVIASAIMALVKPVEESESEVEA